MLPLGTPAPDFRLNDFNGEVVALEDHRDSPGLVVAFICNHCPFVKHVRSELARFASDYQPRGVAVIAINSNDVVPIRRTVRGHGGRGATAVYVSLISSTKRRMWRRRSRPRARRISSCSTRTKVVYRGQFDESRPGKGTASGADRRAASMRCCKARQFR